MLKTKRFIIAEVNGKLKHYTGELTHYSIARRNGINDADVIEKGIFVDSFAQVLDCRDTKHLLRRQNQLFNYSTSIRNNSDYTIYSRVALEGD